MKRIESNHDLIICYNICRKMYNIFFYTWDKWMSNTFDFKSELLFLIFLCTYQCSFILSLYFLSFFYSYRIRKRWKI